MNKVTQFSNSTNFDQSVLIIGFGVVGQSIFNLINNKIKNIDILDPQYNDIKNIEYSKYDNIIISVPTSRGDDINSKYYNKIVKFYLKELTNIKFDGIVIIKSTILYDDIKKFKKKLNIIYWAEFLNDLTAEQDLKNTKQFLIGIDNNTYLYEVYEFFKIISPEIMVERVSLKQAITFKYIRNSYLAYKSFFWHSVADKIGDTRIYNMLLDLFPITEQNRNFTDGRWGFGGKCLPKDFKIFNKKILKNKIFKNILKINKNKRKN